MDDSDNFSENGKGYLVRLGNFEGPLDLLLHLIKKSEMDVYDIQISVITRQYLEYIHAMKELNLEIAGEFLVMASTLIEIKSKMLLPIPVEEESGEEEEDPRAELVRRLLEYRRFKDAAAMLSDSELLGRDLFARKFPSPELLLLDDEEHPMEVDLFELVDAFNRVMANAPAKSLHEVGPESISIAERISDILSILQENGTIRFVRLFSSDYSREYLVATFLAILELCRLRMVKVSQMERYGEIWISPAVLEEDVGAEDDLEPQHH